MNRRQLFLSAAKTALATAFGGSWLLRGARAQSPAPIAAAASQAPMGAASGSPFGTRILPGNVLPAPELPFGGIANLNAAQSTPWWPRITVPPKEAPNVLLIMTDDVGFGAPSTFGGVIPTPTMDRVAKMGPTYTRFHTTALCSPTRAALLTGRNHAPPAIAPWALTLAPPPTDVMNSFRWELYNLEQDWTQATDLVPSMPDKLRDLQEAWIQEASRYNVFPLDQTRISRYVSLKPNYAPGRTVFTYAGELANVPFPGTAGAPNMLNKSYTITAEVEIPDGGAEGVLVTDGGHFGGYGFYLLKGRPVFCWNLVQLALVKWRGADVVAPGRHVLEFDWKYDGPGLGKGGVGTLKVDGAAVDSHPMPKSLPIGIGWCETFCVGVDTGTAVDESDYQVPFRFTGKINKLTMALGPEELTPAERAMIYNTYRDKQ